MGNTFISTPDETYGHLNDEGNPLAGIDCPICKNTGNVVWIRPEDKTLWGKECNCMNMRRNMKHIRDARMEDLVEACSLESYETPTEEQELTKKAALTYCKNRDEKRKWFYICGNPGTGKTHICIGICSFLLSKGLTVRYLKWREDIPRLKAVVTKADQYQELIEPFKQAGVLYIDDFLKGHITDADINIAFEILNHRYTINKRTVISSERTIAEIGKYDEALASRIMERARDFLVIAPSHNWRAKGRPE